MLKNLMFPIVHIDYNYSLTYNTNKEYLRGVFVSEVYK